jgi:adenine-specific DNA-methyltransferase
VPVLIADDAHSTVKTGASEDDHVLIEGDNLAALTMLQATHAGKVNVIYIDPPYNTGNQDFVYNDRFVDPEDSYRHSKWLSFMRPRLVLARELLTSDGVIFVSIDDHEQAYLRVLMDEVFGEGNFVANITAINNRSGRSDDKHIATSHEYLIVYAKDEKSVQLAEFPLLEEQIAEYKEHDSISRYKLVGLKKSGKNSLRTDRPRMYYPIYVSKDLSRIEAEPFDGALSVYPKINGEEGCWRWGKETFIANSASEVVAKRQHGGIVLYTKMRLESGGSQRTIKPKSVWERPEYSTTAGGRIFSDIFGNKVFSSPKSAKYVKDIIRIGSPSKDALVLDFFAGSGTTGQAVAELNKEDGGHRRAILVTNNYEQDGAENGIARSVTAVRMRRVLTGEDWADGKKHDPLPGNLRYYRVGFKALADDADVFTSAFTAPSDIAGVIALAHGTHDVVSTESLAAACPVLATAVVNGRAMVLTNGHGDRVLVYADAVAVMNGADEYEDVLAGFREWAGDKGAVYLASLDESDDDGVVYPLPYVRIVRRTVNGLERQGLLAREK